MKLIRFGAPGQEKPGVIINDTYYDVSAIVRDYDEEFFDKYGLPEMEQLVLSQKDQLPVVSSDTRLGCPVKRPSKIVCIGLNYAEHAAESGAALPSEPVIFFKSTTAVVGPNDAVMIPRGSKKTDWEVELAIVIGKTARYVDEANALQYIAGYTLHNDISEREFQLERNGTWDKGKGCDTFAPIGPFIATKDEIPDPDNLRLWLKVNGKTFQDGNTSTLVFKLPYLVSYVSQFMTLLPGDIISTGTPAGVGLGQKPEPIYLKEGDVMELGIDGLGSSRQEVIAFKLA